MNIKPKKIAMLFIAFLAIVLFVPMTIVQAASSWTPRYINTTVNGQTAPLGYYEYLPTSYNSGSPLSTYPVVIFMHGSGQYGDGTSAPAPTGLANNLTDGLPKMIQNNTSPVAQTGGTFDTNNVIVLCPQNPNSWPIADSSWRAFFNFAIAAYPKIDKRRIWFTGLSYGSTAVTQAMDYTIDPSPDDAAAVVACAWRGDEFNTTAIASIAKVVPFWGLTSQGDFWDSSNPDFLCSAANKMAAAISGGSPTDVYSLWLGLSNYTTTVYTANFNGSSWNWVSGVDATTGVNPKITAFTGTAHNSWDRTYGNTNVWNWMFQQQKPDVSISAPSGSTIVGQGSNITFTGSATDKNGTSLTGSSLVWVDSVNGTLGTGTSVTVNNLSLGAHIVKLQATDNSYRDNKAFVNVTVPYTGAFTSQFDFGDPSETTTSTGWNNITSINGSVTNAVNSSGTAIGVNVTITSSFVGINTAGVVSSALYPTTAQEDTIYIGGAGSAQTGTFVVSGLNPAETYNFTFFASRSASDDRTSTYTIGTSTVSLNAANNTSNTVSLNSITPDSSGQVTITVGHGSGATYGYLGVMVITTSGASSAPSFTDGPPPSTATVGTSYSFTYTASGTPSPTFTLNSGTLPPGLSLASNGVLSGTPTTSGVYSGISVKATNSNGNATTSAFTITVNQAPAITNGPPTSTGTVGTAYSFSYTATGYPAPTFTVATGTLPPGLSLSSAGVLSGTPTTVGTYSGISVTAANSVSSTTTSTFTITISASSLTISESSSAPTGASISQTDFSGTPLITSPNIDVTNGRPSPVQTFTTSSAFTLHSVTVKGHGNNSAGTGEIWNIAIYSVSGTSMTLLDSESATFVPTANTNDYITLSLASPVSLSASTKYAYAVTQNDGNWFVLAVSSTDVLSGGDACSVPTRGDLSPLSVVLNGSSVSYDRTFYLK